MTPPNLAGYTLTEKCYQSHRSLVYRGIRAADQQRVVVKFMQEDPSFESLAHFRNQYYISRQLGQAGVEVGIVTVLALERYQHGYALVMQDSGAVALSDYTSAHPLDLTQFFEVAIALSGILHVLHQQHIIHKDINGHRVCSRRGDTTNQGNQS